MTEKGRKSKRINITKVKNFVSYEAKKNNKKAKNLTKSLPTNNSLAPNQNKETNDQKVKSLIISKGKEK